MRKLTLYRDCRWGGLIIGGWFGTLNNVGIAFGFSFFEPSARCVSNWDFQNEPCKITIKSIMVMFLITTLNRKVAKKISYLLCISAMLWSAPTSHLDAYSAPIFSKFALWENHLGKTFCGPSRVHLLMQLTATQHFSIIKRTLNSVREYDVLRLS